MKTLILFRHGKSDWGDETLPDHERPLAKRGIKAARAMGRFLRRAGQIPASAVTSSAVRARSTLEKAMEAGQWTCTVRVEDSLYGASVRSVLEVIRAEPERTDRLLLVGHEPDFSALIGQFTGGKVVVNKAALALVTCERVAAGSGELAWLVPAALRA